MTHEFFATAPRGAEDLLAAELETIGAERPRARTGGVGFHGSLGLGYRACLWSRVAGRVLLRVAELPAVDGDALYEAARALAWTDHLARYRSFAISAAGTPAPDSGIDNTHYAALRVKDGLVDHLRERWGERPSVDLDAPDLRLRLHLRGDKATLSIELAGEGLHRRGYRVASVAAPLRENLAAAVLLRAGGHNRGAFVDPMCGSGTFLIEAAWLAGDVAPGLLRERWGFEGWAGHDAEVWAPLRDEALARREAGLAGPLPRLIGYDAEPDAVRAALACVEAAGLRGLVHIEKRSLAEVEAPSGLTGLVVCNPPWGERLGNRRELESLYAALGRQLRERFVGWEAALLCGDTSLGRSLGLRARKRNVLHDGPIECQILRIDVHEPKPRAVGADGKPEPVVVRERSEGARSFANRLSKNHKKLRAWCKREGVSCYRLYEADIPEYNFAVDLYEAADTGLVHAHVQEYAPPDTVDEADARRRRGEALAVIREDLGLTRERVHIKKRERQKGTKQYSKLDDSGNEFAVREGPARLWVNLDDYLDTGLFLDHRPVRAKLREAAAGKQVLNLFCYTASVSVHAALGRASSTTSVDLSRIYLEWAARNFALNGLACVGPEDDQGYRRSRPAHELIRDDVLEWVREQGSRRWDLIFCDPPSFSNSKRMRGTLDVQRDHVEIIWRCVDLLRPGGQLWFSTNLRKFKLDEDGLDGLVVEELRGTIPPDFSRNKTVHRCWIIARGA
ncbi:bifunctional 23S rRNA (guanine(2069)-N(7))-methyltransferase RlmK/23S rRNA (guanine(2445)-N(2))-methyltransferase RlmL [Enhygromyxa salina]|uniref:Ribosomal RNA large subunit methyltransferase K/L n=1 Tax=Enhygromyxa salina TaxID=215803 RepID=A0A2S9YM86_9BACT|nr:bifunctional 23S rRNA (guanine(2069)-N(7))-methyltransferase RlmK/23S rRNA (guanine(2445)-N(2))-methyltransferase RlmL [Enhygromyxa salina]PRQ06199.1 Ribosomal RNA large subunit methyltransferase K/L [Enhygromyxa salina]